MDHAAAQHFEPARGTVGLLPGDIDFGGWLGEREVARAEAHLEIALKERAHEFGERALEVGEAGVFVHQQAFDLMEHRRVGLVAVAAIDLAGGDHPQRRLLVQHVAYLATGSMRAQQPCFAAAVGREIEGVVHRARRMVRREVQGFEVVPVVLDLGAVGEFVTEAAEDLGDALQRTADRMQAAACGVASRQGDVDGFAGETRVEHGVVERDLACRQRVADGVAGAVDRFAGRLALVRGQSAEGLELRGDAAALAEQRDPQRFQRVGRVRGRDVAEGLRR